MKNKKTSQMVKEFKDMAELQQFAEAQYKTIIELSKKIQKLEEEKKNAENMLKQSVPLIGATKEIVINDEDLLTKDEEKICLDQLKLLNSKSKSQELTFEETKKVEIYSKVLNSLRQGPDKKIKDPAKKKDTAELLRMMDTENDDDREKAN